MEVGSAASSYEILAKLAEGGMAEIFLARNKTGAGVERLVVLKRVLREVAQDPQLVELFVAEARLAAQLQHPNVVQVYDVGKLGASYFISMEYVHGETVRDLLLAARHHGMNLPIAAVMTIAAGAAAGLQHAHERRGVNGKLLNIVHADISPSNLMITREGIVKIVDFGIAKAEHHQHDVERSVQGKLCYMSPEQVRSRPLDKRSDLFSLGIVLWELLTLRGLFRGESDFNVMDAIINTPPPPPSKLRPDVPREIDELVLKLLAKDPAQRFQSSAELVDAIEIAAVRLTMLLSTASVGRQMRELFGEKPEPWIEETVGGSVKRVVVDSEPVSDQWGQTIAGPIDELLETLKPSQTRPPTIEGAPGWDNPTTLDPPRTQPPHWSNATAAGYAAPHTKESLEGMRERLFREARERQTPPITPLQADVPHVEPSPPANPPPTKTMAGTSAPIPPSRSQQVPVTPLPFPRRGFAAEEKKSPIPLILLAILITLGIGGGAFAILYKTQLSGGSTSSRRDAGTPTTDAAPK